MAACGSSPPSMTTLSGASADGSISDPTRGWLCTGVCLLVVAVLALRLVAWRRRAVAARIAHRVAMRKAFCDMSRRDFLDSMFTRTFYGHRSAEAVDMLEFLVSAPSSESVDSEEPSADRLLAAFAAPDESITAARERLLGQYVCLAARVGNEDVLHAALRLGGRAVHLDPLNGESALMVASKNGNYGCMAALIDRGADVNLRTLRGGTALIWTAINGRAECAALLLAHGADPNLAGADGRAPIHFAAKNGHVRALQVLALFGASASVRDASGNCPIHIAAAHGAVRCLQYLMVMPGSDAQAPNFFGMRPIELAVLAGQKEATLRLLLSDVGSQMVYVMRAVEFEMDYCHNLSTCGTNTTILPPVPSTVPGVAPLPGQVIRSSDLLISLRSVPKNIEIVLMHLLRHLERDWLLPLLALLVRKFCDHADTLLKRAPAPVASADPAESSAISERAVQEARVLITTRAVSLLNVIRLAQSLPQVSGELSSLLLPLHQLWCSIDGRLGDPALGELTAAAAAAPVSLLKPPPQDALDLLVLVDVMYRFVRAGHFDPSALGGDSDAVDGDAFLRFVLRHQQFFEWVCRSNSGQVDEWLDFFMEQCAVANSGATGGGATLGPLVRGIAFERKRAWILRRLRKDAEETGGPDTALLVVNRHEGIMRSSCRTLLGLERSAALGHMEVLFELEAGVGAGVLREWFGAAVAEVFVPDTGLFEAGPVTHELMPAPHAALVQPNYREYYEYSGRLLALSIVHEQVVPLQLSSAVCRMILGQAFGPDDLRSYDAELHRNVVEFLLANPVDDLGLTFAHHSEVLGRPVVAPFFPGGDDVAVTDANKGDYVCAFVQHFLRGRVSEQLDAFLGGFFFIIPQSYIQLFTLPELRTLIGGEAVIDVEDWLIHLDVGHGYTRDSTLIGWLFDAMRAMSQADLALLLQFATGSRRVPIGGFAALKGVDGPQRFTVMRSDVTDALALPTASTCFNLLKIPEYPSGAVLEQRLLTAIRSGFEGFSFS